VSGSRTCPGTETACSGAKALRDFCAKKTNRHLVHRAVAFSLEANDFYDFSRDPFSLFYERHSQLRRAATQVLILLSQMQKQALHTLFFDAHFMKQMSDEDWFPKFQKLYDNDFAKYARAVGNTIVAYKKQLIFYPKR
jgi:hypothetical protein